MMRRRTRACRIPTGRESEEGISESEMRGDWGPGGCPTRNIVTRQRSPSASVTVLASVPPKNPAKYVYIIIIDSFSSFTTTTNTTTTILTVAWSNSPYTPSGEIKPRSTFLTPVISPLPLSKSMAVRISITAIIYLILTHLISPVVRTKLDDDLKPLPSTNLTVSVRCYEYRLGRFGASRSNIVADYTQVLWSKPDHQDYGDVGNLEYTFQIVVPPSTLGYSTVHFPEYRIVWRVEAGKSRRLSA
jgi:hypothetical protein